MYISRRAFRLNLERDFSYSSYKHSEVADGHAGTVFIILTRSIY